jgi:DNA-binding transcriptional MerR regulator/quercetin dioxygenase-like cupin family protein
MASRAGRPHSNDRTARQSGRPRPGCNDRAVPDEPAFAWTIGDAARRAGVSPGTIRLWEQQGLIRPDRSRGGIRLFDATQLRRIERIAYLRSVDKLNLAAIRSVLRNEPSPEHDGSPRTQARSYGKHLRRLRRERGLTLAEVAAGVDLSISFISAIERDEAGASVGTLQRILRFYGTTEHAMMSPERSQTWGTLTSSGGRKAIYDLFSRVTTEQLLPTQASLGASLSIVEPGGGSHGSYTHEGEEFMYLLAGGLRVTLGESELYDLKPGDCLFFASTLEHAWENIGAEPANVMWVSTPPTY